MRTSIHRTRIFGVTWSLLAAGAWGCALEPEGEDLSTESASALTMSLTSEQTVTGLAASGASSNDFTIAIPPGTSGVSMSYTGTGYCTLRFNENAPPSAYAYTAINPLGIACNSSGTFWNVKSGTLYLSLVPLSHTYPNVDGYTNGSLTVTLLTTPLPSVTSFSIPSQLNGGIRFDALVKLDERLRFRLRSPSPTTMPPRLPILTSSSTLVNLRKRSRSSQIQSLQTLPDRFRHRLALRS